MNAYAKIFDKDSKYMNPLVNGKEVSEKYTAYGRKMKV